MKNSNFRSPKVLIIILVVVGFLVISFTVKKLEEWKTYQNENYGFSFAYPKNFQLTEDSYHRVSNLYMEDPIIFELALIQDIYPLPAQIPTIDLEVMKTNKTIEQILDHLKEAVNNRAKLQAENQRRPSYNRPPPEIESIKTITIGDLKMTKVVHYLNEGIPLSSLLQYYIMRPGYVFVFSANYNTSCSIRSEGDCGATEKEILSKILSTFKFEEISQ